MKSHNCMFPKSNACHKHKILSWIYGLFILLSLSTSFILIINIADFVNTSKIIWFITCTSVFLIFVSYQLIVNKIDTNISQLDVYFYLYLLLSITVTTLNGSNILSEENVIYITFILYYFIISNIIFTNKLVSNIYLVFIAVYVV